MPTRGRFPPRCWHRHRILEGSKGPLVADFVAIRAVAPRQKPPGPAIWVVFRRKISGPTEEPELKVYLSCVPAEVPLRAVVRVTGMRWPIEACFAEGNGEVGLAHYELRFWRGWHHHMTMVILAHHFLVRLKQRLNAREGDLQAACPTLDGHRDQPESTLTANHAVGPDHPSARAQGAEPRRGSDAPHDSSSPTGLRPARGVGVAGLSAHPQSRRLPLPSQTHAQTPC